MAVALAGLQDLVLNTLGERLRKLTGSTASLDEFANPSGDPGLFGMQSMAWRVHEHFAAMMVGGVSSLMVQALHPRALAAVWDHSQFRTKLKDRLGRTAYFVAATTYGSEALARRVIQRVNTIHAHIKGVDLAGQAYCAGDPDLIRWVHLVEVGSFLAAYQTLARDPLTPAECDQYVGEMARVGYLLGAHDLPSTWDALQSQWQAHRPLLVFDARAQATLQIIQNYPVDVWDQPFISCVLSVAKDIMPEWVLSVMDQQPSCFLQQQLSLRALQVASEPIQWMLTQKGVSAIARDRILRKA